jgi:hypothetical protein
MTITIKLELRDDGSVTDAKRLIENARKLGEVSLGPYERRLLGEQRPRICAAMSDEELLDKLESVVSRQRDGADLDDIDYSIIIEASHRKINSATMVLDRWSAEGEPKN